MNVDRDLWKVVGRQPRKVAANGDGQGMIVSFWARSAAANGDGQERCFANDRDVLRSANEDGQDRCFANNRDVLRLKSRSRWRRAGRVRRSASEYKVDFFMCGSCSWKFQAINHAHPNINYDRPRSAAVPK